MPDPTRPAGFSLEDAVLDIGGEIGALILYTDAEYDQREIEVSPIDEPEHGQGHGHEDHHDHLHSHEHGQGHGHGHRVHTAIHERSSGGQVTYAGIYPELKAGTYKIWIDDPTLPDRVTIIGGEVAELDWRRGRPG
jgi:hypothetical protein